jgi:hypothetical protein
MSMPHCRSAPGAWGQPATRVANTLLNVKIPIACSLEPEVAHAQLGEWRQLLGRVDHRERVSPTRLELSPLRESDIVDVVRLARREVACCPFFTFAIEIGHERLILAIEVPDEAVGVLDEVLADARSN